MQIVSGTFVCVHCHTYLVKRTLWYIGLPNTYCDLTFHMLLYNSLHKLNKWLDDINVQNISLYIC